MKDTNTLTLKNKIKLIKHQAIILNVCTNCLRKDARKGFKTCIKCSDINKKRSEKRRKQEGRCCRCGKKLKYLDDPKYKSCLKCRQPKLYEVLNLTN